MKTLVYLLISTFMLSGTPQAAIAQVQIGSDIDGEPGDYSGRALSMPDANTVAIGAYYNGSNGSHAGQVRVYTWDGSTWTQKGSGISGEAAYDFSGHSVSMPDANTVAIGAHHNKGSGTQAGHVRIYAWDGTDWAQKGGDLDAEGDYNNFGCSVNMPHPDMVAIGGWRNDGSGINAGHVQVYSWNGSNWVQKGSDLDGEADGDQSGFSVCMPDTNTIAIGAPFNNDGGTIAGHVRIYSWNGSGWVQKGSDIDGEVSGDEAAVVSMPDANTVAIGAPYNGDNGFEAGHVRVYTWNGNAWVQKGSDIDGEAANDKAGWSVSMPDANTLAIGAIKNSNNQPSAGHVRIFSWNGSDWMQRGGDINGEAANDQLGWAVSMPDANTVAVGAPSNDGNGTFAGHVRVYSIPTVGIEALSNFTIQPQLFPNPNNGTFSIDLGNTFSNLWVSIIDIRGRKVMESTLYSSLSEITIQGEAGVYFVELRSEEYQTTLLVIKK